VLNAEVLQKNNINIYTNARINYRESQASAFYRPPASDISNPNGFLPIIDTKILDYAFVAGLKGELPHSVTWDLSNSYGVNDFHYYVKDSMNYSLGTASPKSFDNGSLNFAQNTTNLDFRKSTKGMKIAGGLEFRYENYQITAGESNSYTGTGSQGFAGFTQENAVDEDRYSYAIYIDSIYDFTSDFSLEVLARYEEYSDFGESTNAKLALSYKLTPEVFLRTSGSTGFRAPSLAQSNYSQTSSFVNTNGSLVRQGTFTVNHEVAEALGAKELKSERSKNFSVGSVYQASKNLSLMLDYFYIQVNDRILLTNDLSGETQAQKDILAKNGVAQARFFTNAARTDTQGIDLKLDYQYLIDGDEKLDFNIWFNYTENKMQHSSSMAESEVTTVRIQDGQPKDSLRFLTNYEVDKFNMALNISRFGEYSQMIDSVAYNFDALWITDLDISYEITKKAKVAIGATNLFDITPNKWDGLSGDFYGSNGIKPYSRYSPVGYSGAYYYLRASMEF
ncbi:MAG: hypothetical protein DRG78_12290, partial [Epsilonproteobacteria bacterium]